MKNKYFMSGKSRFNEVEKTKLMDLGYTNFYELRDNDNGYTIEPRAFVNNIGCMATNFEIVFKNKDDQFITDEDFFNRYNPEEDNPEI